MSYESVVEGFDPSAKKAEYSLGPNKISTFLQDTEECVKVNFVSNLDRIILHWGLSFAKVREWKCPIGCEGLSLPPNTVKFDEKAAQTPFVTHNSSLSTLEIQIGKPLVPKKLNFVIKKDNVWYNNNSMDYYVELQESELPKIIQTSDELLKNMVQDIIESETDGRAWTLMHRFNLCNSWLQRVNKTEAYCWILVWMRYSALRKLTWQKGHNTRPSELASCQKNLNYNIVNILKRTSIQGLVNDTVIVRGILNTMGKGGDNGQRIRDEILQIMHRGGIRHRIKTEDPKLAKDNYYEQWHQKLHNNTTPDDIGICEAIIAYNESRDMNKYWEVLTKHGITKERLCSFERAITIEPFYAPQIVPDLYNYLALLKAVHGGADLSQSITSCKNFLSPSINSKLQEIFDNLTHWDKINQMARVLAVRKEIFNSANKDNTEQYRDILYLDIGLESYTRQLCEEIIHIDISIENLCRKLGILLESIQITVRFPELDAAIQDYLAFIHPSSQNESKRNHLLIIKSSCDRIQRVLGNFIDAYNTLIDTKAKFLGKEFSIDQETIDLFTEELIRGSLFFAVSIVSKKIDSAIRKFCGLKSWQIISPVFVTYGIVTKVDSLTVIAYKVFSQPTVLICNKVTGEEEIPEGVVGVICSTELDALAHVSVRARNNKVLLAVCYDEEEIENIHKFIDSSVKVSMTSTGISISLSEIKGHQVPETVAREIKQPLPLEKIILSSEEFCEGRTGAKGNNCAELKRKLPKHIGVPNSVALPYGSNEFILSEPENAELNSSISTLITGLSSSPSESISPLLSEIKSKILQLSISEDLAGQIKSLLRTIGCEDNKWNEAWTAIKSVWGSKYNERVYLSTLKSKIPLNSVVMSVLCQEVITGDYAYVLHTKNPMNNNIQEIYGELVLGLGETLVGAYEGRALSFIANKNDNQITIESFPSKSIYLKGSGFISRSDSNSEDLPGFAGAGLFDSFIMEAPQACIASYSQDKIINDPGFREFFLQKLKEVGILVEDIFCGVPQDIEGVIKGNQIFVVQSRPQV
jgi:alpha-glucan, water dikinase